jgi:phosphonoacetaldehyde hydrolase
MGSILVVDDTVAGIRAGVNAGMRSIGVTRSGNAIGLAEAEVDALPAEERLRRLAAAEREFFAAGAECCVESVAELVAMLRSGMLDGASGRGDTA